MKIKNLKYSKHFTPLNRNKTKDDKIGKGIKFCKCLLQFS